MNHLRSFGLKPDLTKQEFTDVLYTRSLEDLLHLRQALYHDLTQMNVVPIDIPLVTRRDSALRPVGRALSEDCWVLADCISNQKCPPRVLFKNGKRDKLTVENQPRSFTSTARSITTVSTPDLTIPAFMSGNLPQQPQLLSENHALGTSKSEISNRLVAREIATVREQLASLQTEI